MLASAQNAEERSQIYAALGRRNRLVRILRVGLPALGAVVLAGLVLQLVIGSLLNDFGISNVRIDRDNLVVDTPSYSSMTADGTMYSVSSQDARASLGDTDLLHLTTAQLTVTKPSGSTMEAMARQAEMRLSSQNVFVPDEMEFSDSQGTTGIIRGVHVDLLAETMVSDGPAHIVYHNGTRLEAETMSYNGNTQTWVFNGASLVVPAPASVAAEDVTP